MINYITEYSSKDDYDSSIIIVTEKTGGGHEAVANALLESFMLLGKDAGDKAEKILVEKYYGFSEAGLTAQAMGGLYNFFLKHWPKGEKLYFDFINFTAIDKNPIFLWKASGILKKMAERKKPAVIISVYPLVQEAGVVAKVKNDLGIPLITVMTDPFPPFWEAWTCGDMDYYFVPEMETKEEVMKDKNRLFSKRKGVDPDNIHVSGMCVHPKFFAIKEDKPENSVEKIKKSLGLNLDKFTLFVNAGWNGNNSYIGILQNLLESGLTDIQILFLAGNNDKLYNRAVDLVSGSDKAFSLPDSSETPPAEKGKIGVKVRGFSNDMEKLMRVSDLMISKTGAATGYEAFTSGLPILIDALHGFMPQELGLAEFIIKNKLGYFLKSPEDTADIIKQCLEGEVIIKYSAKDVGQENADQIVEKLCSDGSRYLDWKENVKGFGEINAANVIALQIDNYLKNKKNEN